MTPSKILIVEDDWFTAEDTKNMLEGLGYEVPAIVSSGEEAVKKAEEGTPDLVLMDIVLKGAMDGIEAAGRIHDQFNIPIVYVTAHVDKGLMERAKITEPFGYITKPFEDAELHTTIEIALYKHKAEETIRQKSALNQTLLDALPCVALLLKPSTREIVASNEAGRQAGALPGKTCYGTWGQRNNPCPWCLAPKACDTGDPQHLEVDAIDIVWDAHWYPINDDLYLHYAFDITEKRKLEDQLVQSQKLETIGTLAGGIAHDFNNILSPIMIHSQLAMTELPPESPLQHNLDEIYNSATRARDLVKQILTFSRQSRPRPMPLKISLIVQEALKLLRSTLPTTIAINQKIDAESDTVFADPTQIHQVLMNLCTNAAHAMREKGGGLEVNLTDVRADSDILAQCPDLVLKRPYLKLAISDTGHGIEPAEMGKIFEPYFTTKQKGEGTGLGLAVVHGIIKNHDGAISVKSEPGKGTTFMVFLPIIETEVKEEVETIEALPKGSERILFIDDEKAMLDAVTPMLESLGYQATSKMNSLDALELFRTKPDQFDLVITDTTMPRMTGDKLAKELMEIRSDIPIIICTGYSERISETKAKGMGIKAFVMKPIVMSEMAHTIRQVLDKK